MSARRGLIALGGIVGLSGLILRAKKAFPARQLTVFTYHRVLLPPADMPWDVEVVSATPESFRRQLEYIKKHFTVITSEQLLQWKRGHADLPRNPAILTFDDGYRDCHDVALPLLKEVGLRADFFVCPWNVENRRLFWWDKIAFFVSRSGQESIQLNYPHPIRLELYDDAARYAAARALRNVIKRTHGLDMERFLAEIQERARVGLDERREADSLLMTWDHIRALRRNGMGIGSHSHTHPILALADEETARRELSESKRALEEKLEEPVAILAYPVGRFTAQTKRIAAECGYEMAYSYCTGASSLRAIDWYEVRRTDVDRSDPHGYFRMRAALPSLF